MLRIAARIPAYACSLLLILALGPVTASASSSPSTGIAPLGEGSVPVQPVRQEPGAVTLSTLGAAAFGVELFPNENLRYVPDAGKPGEWIYAGDVEGTAYYAGDFVGNDFSRLYVIDYNLNELHALAMATGADAKIGDCLPLAGHVWTGATGTADGVFYATSTDNATSHLYTVDVATGDTQSVGQITNAMVIIDVAMNGDGLLYGLDINADSLVQIDPTTGAGTVVGPVGYNADYAQGMDFDPGSGVLYLAAFNAGAMQGELRIADTATGNTTLIDTFPDEAQVGAFAFTPPPMHPLQNPGWENAWTGWEVEGTAGLSSSSHTGDWAARLGGETCWVWQYAFVPSDVLEVTLGYWLTGISSDSDFENDILCYGIWDLARQTDYASKCFGLAYFTSYPMKWRQRFHRLDADELASIAGKPVVVGFRLEQDWNPGYHRISTAYVDDAVLTITRPLYAYGVYLPLAIR